MKEINFKWFWLTLYVYTVGTDPFTHKHTQIQTHTAAAQTHMHCTHILSNQ